MEVQSCISRRAPSFAARASVWRRAKRKEGSWEDH